jgi:hypothetical protein
MSIVTDLGTAQHIRYLHLVAHQLRILLLKHFAACAIMITECLSCPETGVHFSQQNPRKETTGEDAGNNTPRCFGLGCQRSGMDTRSTCADLVPINCSSICPERSERWTKQLLALLRATEAATQSVLCVPLRCACVDVLVPEYYYYLTSACVWVCDRLRVQMHRTCVCVCVCVIHSLPTELSW